MLFITYCATICYGDKLRATAWPPPAKLFGNKHLPRPGRPCRLRADPSPAVWGKYAPKIVLGMIELDCNRCSIYTWSVIGCCKGTGERAQKPLGREKRVVTKKEIVRTISEEIGLTQLKTKEIVQKTFDAIVECLVAEGRIELRNFGVFEVKRRAPRKARNPRTGDQVNVAEKYVVTFKPGKEMEQRVRELVRQAAARAAAGQRAGNSNPGGVAEPAGAAGAMQGYSPGHGGS
jgi:integration host factor subunit beta